MYMKLAAQGDAISMHASTMKRRGLSIAPGSYHPMHIVRLIHSCHMGLELDGAKSDKGERGRFSMFEVDALHMSQDPSQIATSLVHLL